MNGDTEGALSGLKGARNAHHLIAGLSKMFPTPRIATEKIPECLPHIERGDHKRLYRFSPDDYSELSAVFNGPRPEKAFVPDPHP